MVDRHIPHASGCEPPTDASTLFEDDDLTAEFPSPASGGESRQACPDDDDGSGTHCPSWGGFGP